MFSSGRSSGRNAQQNGKFQLPAAPAILGTLLVGLAGLLQVIGFSTNYWFTLTVYKVVDEVVISFPLNWGLWTGIPENAPPDTTLAMWIHMARFFGICPIFGLAACFLGGALMCFVRSKIVPIVVAVFALMSWLSIVVEYGIFCYYCPWDELKGAMPGFSFQLTIAAMQLTFGASFCFMSAAMAK